MRKTPKFQRHVGFADKIRALKPKTEIYFAGGKPSSLKAIASRIGTSSKPKRIYYTQSEANGVIVWRET